MISIIVPVFNTEKYLSQCVESVINQTYDELNLILVDDGSTDSSSLICDEFARIDKRVSVIHKKNGGLSDARNVGLSVANGEGYIIFLDSDDYWCDKNALYHIARIIKNKHPDAVRFPFQKYYQKNNSFQHGLFSNTSNSIKTMLKSGTFCACACAWAINASTINNNQMRFVVGQMSEDIEWCTKMLLYIKSYEIYNNDFYVYRQQNTSSITSNVKLKNLEDIAEVIQKYSIEGLPETVYHFMAEQLVLLLTTAYRVKDKGKAAIFNKLENVKWLLKYDNCPHVRATRALVGTLGIKSTSIILGVAYNLRSRR